MFIPDITVLTPVYSLRRLEYCFKRAREFIPERWYERPEMLRDKNAWVPFNVGTFSLQCGVSIPCLFSLVFHADELSRAIWMR